MLLICSPGGPQRDNYILRSSLQVFLQLWSYARRMFKHIIQFYLSNLYKNIHAFIH